MSRVFSKTILSALLALSPSLLIAQQPSSSAADAQKDPVLKAMLEELEEAERADREAKSADAVKKQRYAQEAEQIRDAGRRMVEERQAELRRQQEEAERAEKSAQDELEPPPLGAYMPSTILT